MQYPFQSSDTGRYKGHSITVWTWRLVWCGLGVLVSPYLSGRSVAFAQDTASPEIKQESERCFQLYRKKFFLQSAPCYEALRKKHKSPQYLVNIAQSYRLAALNQLNPTDAAILREKAIAALEEHKKEAPQSNFWSDSMIQKLEKLIGSAGVSLSSAPVSAEFVLTGDKYLRKGTMPLTAKLRPGTYTLQLTANGYLPKQHTLEVKPETPVTLRLDMVVAAPLARKPDDRKPDVRGFDGAISSPVKPSASSKPRPLAWAAVAVAGALIVTGVVFVGVSASNQGQIANPATPARQARDALYQSGWQTPTGWTFVGLGAAAGIGAAVLFFLPQKQTAAPKTASLLFPSVLPSLPSVRTESP
ncbi:hypothetical protein L6R29_05910 [Myxococcota bacterium]|nr:hypothetical protein [Myxococcota bacterium]